MNILFRILLAGTLICVAAIINPVAAQTSITSSDSLKIIPTDIMVIIKKSCFGCHAEPGKSTAKMHVNFSKWDEYSTEKQASKAKAMCNEVTKDKMPPMKFRENNPDAALTKEELKVLCDWAGRMQGETK
jgi:hypothetical protein